MITSISNEPRGHERGCSSEDGHAEAVGHGEACIADACREELNQCGGDGSKEKSHEGSQRNLSYKGEDDGCGPQQLEEGVGEESKSESCDDRKFLERCKKPYLSGYGE